MVEGVLPLLGEAEVVVLVPMLLPDLEMIHLMVSNTVYHAPKMLVMMPLDATNVSTGSITQ